MKKLKAPNLNKLNCPTFSLDGLAPMDNQIASFLSKYNINAKDLQNIGVIRKIVNHPLKPNLDKFFIVYSGNFSSFKAHIEDREFLTIHEADLEQNEVLQLTEVKQLIAGQRIFTEST